MVETVVWWLLIIAGDGCRKHQMSSGLGSDWVYLVGSFCKSLWEGNSWILSAL